MLTRLRVSGFKNLVDCDVQFGPFTCIAGANGVGKSNLFDAIMFLSALADRSLVDAASSVRDEGGRAADVRSLFHHGGGRSARQMSFDAEMIIPAEGPDDLGQKAEASITFVRYRLDLSYRSGDAPRSLGGIQIDKEELMHITRGDAAKHLNFPHQAATWRKSVIQGQRRAPSFISTDGDGPARVIRLHQDGISGRPLSRPASTLPRTVLSVTNTAESPTALLTRREMQSWQLLQLEPSALRRPDEFLAPTRLSMDGSHLPATLYHLGQINPPASGNGSRRRDTSEQVHAQIANRLSELIDDVREVTIDRDERRELLTLQVRDASGAVYPARALSDGTLRFLALAVLQRESDSHGIVCLEEPENGIHPARIPAMLRLLQDIAVDVFEPVGPDNPLRQVIINTHAPFVVQQVPDDSLLFAGLEEVFEEGKPVLCVRFRGLSDTWRDDPANPFGVVSRGQLLAYLNPETAEVNREAGKLRLPNGKTRRSRRVIDRADIQQLMLPLEHPV